MKKKSNNFDLILIFLLYLVYEFIRMIRELSIKYSKK